MSLSKSLVITNQLLINYQLMNFTLNFLNNKGERILEEMGEKWNRRVGEGDLNYLCTTK